MPEEMKVIMASFWTDEGDTLPPERIWVLVKPSRLCSNLFVINKLVNEIGWRADVTVADYTPNGGVNR